MTNYLERARAALRGVLQGRAADRTEDAASTPARPDIHAAPISAGDNLAVVAGRLTFVDPVKAAATPTSWIEAFDTAVRLGAEMSDRALALIDQHAGRYTADAWLTTDRDRRRLVEFLRLRPGLSERLAEMSECGLAAAMFPELGTLQRPSSPRRIDPHSLLAVQNLERLVGDRTLSGERFGSMVRELEAPELLVLSLLLHNGGKSKDEHDVEGAVRSAEAALDRVQLAGEARQTVRFLIRNQLQMSRVAFRLDIGDPDVMRDFAALFSAEEHLKLLCLMTVAEIGADSPEALTPWKSELLWRLFVDTYNHLTLAYGDEVIDKDEAVVTALHANRPHDISEQEMAKFLEGLPRRYLTLFEPDSIYQHVRLWRNIGPNDVHFFLKPKSDAWELTVVTLDKPYLFSNICGVLSYLDLDILRGHALTSLGSLVLDVFQFTDHKGCLVRPPLDPILSDVVAGRVDITSLILEKERSVPSRLPGRMAPVIYFDHESSLRYTVLELVVEDAPGLLHRISRVISRHQCDVDLVLISTEAHKAIDVFHMRKGAAKLTDSDELTLTEDLERMLENTPENPPEAPVVS